MTMGRGDLAWEQVLKAGPERVRRAVARRETGIDEPEYPPFGAATERGQLAAAPDEGQERVPAPEVRYRAAPRLLRQEVGADVPERHEVISLQLFIECLRVVHGMTQRKLGITCLAKSSRLRRALGFSIMPKLIWKLG